ncbi:MAG: HupE/UreJ family protein [Polaromonas sp.]|nr:MAG: HupE/UreJ family protein [Polaromonas sp.]
MLAWLMLALLAPTAAWAHKPSDSYLTVRAAQGTSTLSIRWDIALRDLDYVLQLDRDGNGDLSWGEVRQREADITKLAASRLTFTAAGTACALANASPMMLDKHSDGTYAVLSLSAQCASLEAPLRAGYSMLFDVDPSHRGLVQWVAPGVDTAQALVFGAESAEQVLALQPGGVWQTLKQYIKDGVWHIWIGYDHILFLLALLLPAVLLRKNGQWEPAPTLRGAFIEVVKVVTAFTVAHSITLTLASLQIISLPSRLVESVIAASVVLAALNNLRGTIEGRRWAMAFVFGLIHGFGFASVLADLGLPQNALILALVGFNVGVEMGQLSIVAVFLPLAFWLRRTRFYRVGVLTGGSLLVALLASWWLAQRMFDL